MTDKEMLTNLNLLTKTLSEGSRMRIALEKAIGIITTLPSEETIDNILDELSDEFMKLDLPIGPKLKLFAIVQTAIRFCANSLEHLSESTISTHCDDYISRDAAILKLTDWFAIVRKLDILTMSTEEIPQHCTNLLNEVPSAKVNTVSEWKVVSVKNGTDCICRACKNTMVIHRTPYCPNCGAQMLNWKE